MEMKSLPCKSAFIFTSKNAWGLLARAVGVPVGSTGTTSVATIFIILSFFFPFFSPLLRSFLTEGVLGSKNLFSESRLK